MSFPSQQKSYDFSFCNKQITDNSNECVVDNTLLHIKNSMVSLGWSVKASSDGGMASAEDRWSSDAHLVHNYAGFAHSWIVFDNSELDLEVCFDLCICI